MSSDEHAMIDIHSLSARDFSDLPLVVEGESKEIRDGGTDHGGKRVCVIRLKPTIYSFTHNRTGVVPGSDALRLRATKVLVAVLTRAGINHAYREVSENFILADLIEKPPNIEVIVKAFHGGTSKHRYYGMNGSTVREGSNFSGAAIKNDDAYPHALVRFDWRNPFWHPGRVERMRQKFASYPDDVSEWPDESKSLVRLADEILPEPMADWFIDTARARLTALRSFKVLSDFLAECNIVINDLCLFITENGEEVFGEISQDCGRFRHFDLGSLDKDVWRAGGSAEQVLEKWQILAELIEASK